MRKCPWCKSQESHGAAGLLVCMPPRGRTVTEHVLGHILCAGAGATVAFCMEATVTRNAGVVALLKITITGGRLLNFQV